MTRDDFSCFEGWFDVLAVTHRLQASEDIRAKMKAEYFDVLVSYPIDSVEIAYQNLRRKMKKWPVPADWLEALPPFGSVERLPALLPSEQRLNAEAERLGYEQPDVCQCAECVNAGCFMPPRYVPTLDRDGAVQSRRAAGRIGRPILLGRWIHGHELKAWYAARAKFYESETALAAKMQAERETRRDPEARMRRMLQIAAGVQAEHTA